MKLTQNTIALLKNFSAINPNMVFSEGRVLKTLSSSGVIMATAEIEEEVPSFGIYDLNEFLSVVSMFNEPELEFDSNMKSVRIGNNVSNVRYYLTDVDLLMRNREKYFKDGRLKDIRIPTTEVEFTVSSDQLSALRRAASTLSAEQLVIERTEPNDGLVFARVTNVKDGTANSYNTEVSNVVLTDPKSTFSFIFDIGNIKTVNDDYKVSISSKLMARFESPRVTYYIAINKGSQYKHDE